VRKAISNLTLQLASRPEYLIKTISRQIASIVLVLALADCSTDQDRTRTEGTAFGVLVGGVLGATAGAAIAAATGNGDKIAEYAGAGAGLGALFGGVAGYNWGASVARKKEKYVHAEDYLNDCIGDAHKCTLALKQENQILRNQIADLNQKTRQLQVDSQNGRATRQKLTATADNINQRRADVQRKLQHAGEQLRLAQQALTDSRSQAGVSQGKIDAMKSEIRALSAQKAEMQAQNQQLARISGRLGV
jgi:hypothetical protein